MWSDVSFSVTSLSIVHYNFSAVLLTMRVPGLVCDKLDIDILIHIYKNDINNHKIFWLNTILHMNKT